MTYLSTRAKEFLGTLERWMHDQPEILVLIRSTRTAGSKSFEFFSSFASLVKRLLELPPSTNIIVFRQPQLPLRGVVDDSFIEKCMSNISETSEFLVVETISHASNRASRLHHEAGESHQELRSVLEELRGRTVATGTYPPWQEDSADVISGIIPDDNGDVRPGIY